MAVVTPNRTVGNIYRDVARMSGQTLNQGIATAGATTSLTDAISEQTPTAQAADVTGTFIYVDVGTSAGTAKEINAYTLGAMVWSGTVVAPDATSTWVRTRCNPQIILEAIAAVQRLYAFRYPQDYLTEAIVTNSLLSPYGAVEEWAGGAAAAPDGWALSGAGAAVARESTIIAQGLYSQKLTAGGGATGVLTYTVPQDVLAMLDGQTITLQGWIAASVAGDVTVRVAYTNSAGTTTNTDWTSTLTTNRWQRLEDITTAGVVLPDPVVAVTVSLRAVASAVVYADDIALLGPNLRIYDVPATLIGIQPVIEMETAFGSRIYKEVLRNGQAWLTMPVDSTSSQKRRIQFLTDLPSGRHLRIRGYRASSVVSTTTSNVEMNPEALTLYAAKRVLESLPVTEEIDTRLKRVAAEIDMQKRENPEVMDGRRYKQAIWLENR